MTSLYVRIDAEDVPLLPPTLLARHAEMQKEAGDHAGAIQQARDDYTNDDIEIDDNPPVAVADNGVWVAAWVWVQNEDDDDDL